MELKELLDTTLEIFQIDSVSELSGALYDAVINSRTEKYSAFKTLVEDLSIDWLQKIFQYYEADRKEKMQDYTPTSLARFCARLTAADDEETVLDMCAGSGALTIQKWNENNSLKFVCMEFDANVISFLLFNLAVRNIDAIVLHSDVLSGEVFAAYSVTAGEGFSTVRNEDIKEYKGICSSCVSNPPYNMKWNIPEFAQLQERFSRCDLPPASNANYAFVLTAISNINGRAAMILPNGVLSTDNKSEKAIRQYLVEQNLIEAIILCPDNMFEKTTIPTNIIVLNKNKNTAKIVMIDMRRTYEIEARAQKGQYGGKSHENRTYLKNVKIFTDEHMQKAIDCIHGLKDLPEFSKSVTIADIAEQDFLIVPSRYIEFQERESQHRKYSDIMNDINRIIAEKNRCKLTINETIAKSLGLHDIWQAMKQSNKYSAEQSEFYNKIAGCRIAKENWISCTKNKGELKFENGSKDDISSVLMMIIQTWKQHIFYLNQEENRYLAELRDALLPDLMNGKIQI